MDQVMLDLRNKVRVRAATSIVHAMTASSLAMAVTTAGATIWGYHFLLFSDWWILSALLIGAIFGVYCLNQKREGSALDTFFLVLMVSGLFGLLWAEIALLTSPEVFSIVLWSEAIVIIASFTGLMFSRVFQRRSLLIVLLVGLLFLVIGFEQMVFLYLALSDITVYQMSWLGWTGVIIFLGLMFLSWHEAMNQAEMDHAVVASAGPIVNCVALF